MLKSTYGTGCFALLNTGTDGTSRKTACSRPSPTAERQTTYALEGSIFMAGATVQWLRDGLKIIDDAADSGAMAEKPTRSQDVYLVPAFTGLGAPYWDADARGAIFGMTRAPDQTNLPRQRWKRSVTRPAILLEAMRADWPIAPATPCCASMAAWLPPTGPCNSSADILMRLWTGRPYSRRLHLARPGWRVRMLVCGRTWRALPRVGRSTNASNLQ